MKKYFGLLFMLLFILSVSGCKSSKPNENRILSDLKTKNEVTQFEICENTQNFEITSCKIESSSQSEFNSNYLCIVALKSADYEVVSEYNITYTEEDDHSWTMSQCEKTSQEITPINGIQDENEVKRRIVFDCLSLNADKENIKINNIEHSYNKEAKIDNITVDYTYQTPFYKQTGTATIKERFEDERWCEMSNSASNTNGGWITEALIGTWRFDDPQYKNVIDLKITEVNPNNKTCIMQYRIVGRDDDTGAFSEQQQFTYFERKISETLGFTASYEKNTLALGYFHVTPTEELDFTVEENNIYTNGFSLFGTTNGVKINY